MANFMKPPMEEDVHTECESPAPGSDMLMRFQGGYLIGEMYPVAESFPSAPPQAAGAETLPASRGTRDALSDYQIDGNSLAISVSIPRDEWNSESYSTSAEDSKWLGYKRKTLRDSK
jgi:hypothetical protein